MKLNEREQAIVTGLAQGKTPKEIAGTLGLSGKAVQKRIERMRDERGYRTTVEMVCALNVAITTLKTYSEHGTTPVEHPQPRERSVVSRRESL